MKDDFLSSPALKKDIRIKYGNVTVQECINISCIGSCKENWRERPIIISKDNDLKKLTISRLGGLTDCKKVWMSGELIDEKITLDTTDHRDLLMTALVIAGAKFDGDDKNFDQDKCLKKLPVWAAAQEDNALKPEE